MKKIILLLSVAVLGFSCSDDDEGSSISTSDLVGTWTLQSITEDGEVEDLNECESQDALTFTEDTVTELEHYLSSTTSIDADGNEVTTEECMSRDAESSQYRLSGSELYVTYTYTEDGEEMEDEDYEGVASISGDTLTITFEATAGSESYSYIEVYTR